MSGELRANIRNSPLTTHNSPLTTHHPNMTGFVHAALGAAIGRYTKNPVLSFVLGFSSHIVGDVVPHLDRDIGEVPLVFGTLAQVGRVHGWKSGQF